MANPVVQLYDEEKNKLQCLEITALLEYLSLPGYLVCFPKDFWSQ